MQKEYKTISEIAGPLVFVEKTEPVGYGELVQIAMPDVDYGLSFFNQFIPDDFTSLFNWFAGNIPCGIKHDSMIETMHVQILFGLFQFFPLGLILYLQFFAELGGWKRAHLS